MRPLPKTLLNKLTNLGKNKNPNALEAKFPQADLKPKEYRNTGKRLAYPLAMTIIGLIVQTIWFYSMLANNNNASNSSPNPQDEKKQNPDTKTSTKQEAKVNNDTTSKNSQESKVSNDTTSKNSQESKVSNDATSKNSQESKVSNDAESNDSEKTKTDNATKTNKNTDSQVNNHQEVEEEVFNEGPIGEGDQNEEWPENSVEAKLLIREILENKNQLVKTDAQRAREAEEGKSAGNEFLDAQADFMNRHAKGEHSRSKEDWNRFLYDARPRSNEDIQKEMLPSVINLQDTLTKKLAAFRKSQKKHKHNPHRREVKRYQDRLERTIRLLIEVNSLVIYKFGLHGTNEKSQKDPLQRRIEIDQMLAKGLYQNNSYYFSLSREAYKDIERCVEYYDTLGHRFD